MIRLSSVSPPINFACPTNDLPAARSTIGLGSTGIAAACWDIRSPIEISAMATPRRQRDHASLPQRGSLYPPVSPPYSRSDEGRGISAVHRAHLRRDVFGPGDEGRLRPMRRAAGHPLRLGPLAAPQEPQLLRAPLEHQGDRHPGPARLLRRLALP